MDFVKDIFLLSCKRKTNITNFFALGPILKDRPLRSRKWPSYRIGKSRADKPITTKLNQHKTTGCNATIPK